MTCLLTSLIVYTQITFEKHYGGNYYDSGYSVAQTFDGGFIIAGISDDSLPSSTRDFYLVRTNNVGDTLWTRTFGGISIDDGRSVAATSDGGFVIAGQTQSFCSGLADVYLIKTDSNGLTNYVTKINDNTYVLNVLLNIYPNPAKNKLTVESLQKSTIEIIDIQGQTILQKQLQLGQTDIDISELAKGLYILRLNSNDRTEVTKFVKE